MGFTKWPFYILDSTKFRYLLLQKLYLTSYYEPNSFGSEALAEWWLNWLGWFGVGSVSSEMIVDTFT